MTTTLEEKLDDFYHFPGSKNHWKKYISKTFLVQERSLKRLNSINFLSQKTMKKYGISSTYSIPFVSLKILTCLQYTVTYGDVWKCHTSSEEGERGGQSSNKLKFNN